MSTTVGWQAMGKPDFSQAAKLFYRLPSDIREQCNRSEEKVLIWAVFLTWTTAFRSGRNGSLTSFSETWIGAKFGRSRWTVLRALAKLEDWGLIKRIRRSPKKDGTYQTNLIALTARLTSIFGTKNAQPREKSPCSKTAPQEVENVYKRDKAASFSSPPLVPSQEEEEIWKKESAGSAKQMETTFFSLMSRLKPSVKSA